MSEIILLTQEGYNEKDAELDNLIKVERPAAIEAVRVAREFGDLSENAEYDAAKDRQGRVESRIQELEYLLAHAKIISDGEEFCCNQMKSTNGGNPMPYDCFGFDDAYEMFFLSIQ